jgi:co-chaperonin GroES (HSP10)
VPAVIQEEGVTTRVTQFEDRPEIGLVVSVGPDVTSVGVGTIVFFGKYSSTQLTYEDTTYLIIREEDVYCVTD